MSGDNIDPVELGRFFNMTEETHSNVKTLVEKREADDKATIKQDKRITALETRNKNIKNNWKNVGWFLTAGGAISAVVWSVLKAGWAILT